MKAHALWWTLIVVMLIVPGVASAGKTPVAGEILVDMQLDAPDSPDTRAYLGLHQSGAFNPTVIAGRLLIIEIFSMYCPHCQREAPFFNRLFQSIEGSETLREQVKMIGIGVGNSAFEVDYFRKHYQIPFPLFPDEEFVIHQAVGEVRTPFIIIVATGSDDKGKILWTGSGKLDPLETFIDRLSGFLKKR